ncbi:PepSY domain-containing protein, partial [Sphingomonas sp.]|uniref:PepSY domain-containing protein n=1 Tax=Sphingomonas sp. TaxID=28214 RepID=UPI002DB633B6
MPEWMLATPASPASGSTHQHMEEAKPELPWAVSGVPGISTSTGRSKIDVDEAVRLAWRAGLKRPFSLSFPLGPKGAWVASYAPDKAEDVRTLYFDQFDGHLLGDVRFGDYGPAAKAISWGIAVHQGQQYGTANRALMLAGCSAIVMLALSSLIMWLKRRPAGALGIPPLPADRRTVRGVLLVVAAAGLLFPLVGLSLVAALCVEGAAAALRRLAQRTTRWV